MILDRNLLKPASSIGALSRPILADPVESRVVVRRGEAEGTLNLR
jgi:hypothetical protein